MGDFSQYRNRWREHEFDFLLVQEFFKVFHCREEYNIFDDRIDLVES